MSKKELIFEGNFFISENYEKGPELQALALNTVKELHDQELGPEGSLSLIDMIIDYVVKMSNFCARDSGKWTQDMNHKDVALSILERAARADKDTGLEEVPVSFSHELRADLN